LWLPKNSQERDKVEPIVLRDATNVPRIASADKRVVHVRNFHTRYVSLSDEPEDTFLQRLQPAVGELPFPDAAANRQQIQMPHLRQLGEAVKTKPFTKEGQVKGGSVERHHQPDVMQPGACPFQQRRFFFVVARNRLVKG